MTNVKFRGFLTSDTNWMTEEHNDSESARFWEPHPQSEHEVRRLVGRNIGQLHERIVIAEVDGEPAGSVALAPESSMCAHSAEIGIFVRKKFWGKGVGSTLMKEIIELAKQHGTRKLELDTCEGNERVIALYRKFEFEIEAFQTDRMYVEGTWKKYFWMGAQLAPLEPRFKPASEPKPTGRTFSASDLKVRQLMNDDLKEVNRLQNCAESTKVGVVSSHRVPPTPMGETQKWYEDLDSFDGTYCLACFGDDKLLGYVRFTGGRPPRPHVTAEEMIVDVNQRPEETASALVVAVKDFRNRYGYREAYFSLPQTSATIIVALENQGFKNTGAVKGHFFIDGCYVDEMFYEHP